MNVDIELLAAFGEYDRTWPLRSADVQIPGVRLDVHFLEPSDIFRRMCAEQAFDVSEMSLGAHCSMTAAGDCPFVGLPAFPSRAFRHAMIFLNEDSGIDVPADLNGKRIGIREWGMTAVVWIVGILGDHYGFDLHSAKWVAAQAPRVAMPMPANTAMRILEPGEDLVSMLETGDLDAALLLSDPSTSRNGRSNVRRLFSQHAAEERAYYQRTGLHPLMHTVVLRRALYEAHNGLAERLYAGLCRAREHAKERLADTGVLSAMLPFLAQHVAETREAFGEDYWPYGVEPNRPELECLVRYAYEQGLTSRQLAAAELFAPEFADTRSGG